MELREGIKQLLMEILEEFSYHPLIAPYLCASRDNPPQHYLHQYEVLARLVFRKPIRALIGDEIGLGKTITALMVARYLEKLGRVSKILVVVPRVLVGQWRKEFLRMGIPASKIRHLERENLDFLKRQGFPVGYYLASVDLLKREERINEVLHVPWDLVIIDEVHKLGYRTERFWKIGKMLVEAKPGRDVIFLSATPHRGVAKDYILRFQLLDPYLPEGWRALDNRPFYEATHGSLLFRRTKEDINKIYEGKEIFPPAKFYAGVVKARDDETEFVERLVNFLRTKLVEFAYEKGLISERIIPLLTILIFKRATSSPYAAMRTLERMLVKRAAPELSKELIDRVRSFIEVGYEDYEYLEKDPEEVFNEFLDATSPLLSDRDREEIRRLRDMAKTIMEKGDSKLNAVISLLEDIMAEDGSKVIVFTEYKDTLEYMVENLKLKHQEWFKSILRLSSDETRDEKVFQRIRNAFENDPKAKILIATDVVAEGVNLQVAHIIINYEIPWSFVKLEQRIGRVWRLGQKREVEAYTMFMANIADQTALNSMYEKLLNLKRAKLSPRPVTGQEVLLYAEAEDLTRFPPSVAVRESRGKKKFFKVTEAKSILTYLREDKAGLDSLVASIIAARQEIENELASKGILYKPKIKEEVEGTVGLLGFKSPAELIESMKSLIRSSSSILGFKVSEEGEALKVSKGFEMPLLVDTLDDIYGILAEGRSEKRRENPLGLIAYGHEKGKVVLMPIQIKDKRSGMTLYRELIGIDVDRSELLRGSAVLQLLSQALSSCLGIVDPTKTDLEISINLIPNILENVRRSILRLLEPVSSYVTKLSNASLRELDKTWIKPTDMEIILLDPIAYIRFIEAPKTLAVAIPEAVRRKAEEKAVEIVIEIERAEGRVPVRVPDEEHYDIKSVSPSTDEIRFIEVKGHMGPEVYGELTDEEAKLADKEGNCYWLYIVYNIESGKNEWIRFRDPLRTMNWRVFERVEKRYLLWPKGRNGV
ncbi:MAG: helicase-related protein [Nitrososphaerales archaeon]